MMPPTLIERYREFLPLTHPAPDISIGEGDTPLVQAPALSRETHAQIFLKLEGCNPTGSFKDRGMVVAMAAALQQNARAVICASTGNTAASAAAYAARANLTCAVVIPHGNIALGKLSQALIYGARVLPIEGSFDQALELVREVAERYSITVVNSINPYRLEGQKTAAFEIVEALGRAPDILALPVGNAGNITAYWKGFTEWFTRDKISARPRMFGFQAEGAAPIVRGEAIKDPQTRATAIRIGRPASWRGASAARDESNGVIESVTDDEIISAFEFLARHEGVYVELASAAGVAGILKLARANRLGEGQTIVCVLTGNGLKDPDFALSRLAAPKPIPATVEALAEALAL
jgi:threonine synthase